jgi:hypothetical protein
MRADILLQIRQLIIAHVADKEDGGEALVAAVDALVYIIRGFPPELQAWGLASMMYLAGRAYHEHPVTEDIH